MLKQGIARDTAKVRRVHTASFMPTRGLTLGKFAPFHNGHQFLIETALAEVDEAIVLVYDCPKTTAAPLSLRATWIRQLYPAVKVIEVWDGSPTYHRDELYGNGVMAFKRIESWLYWIVVDVIAIGLYYVNEARFLSLLYAIF